MLRKVTADAEIATKTITAKAAPIFVAILKFCRLVNMVLAPNSSLDQRTSAALEVFVGGKLPPEAYRTMKFLKLCNEFAGTPLGEIIPSLQPENRLSVFASFDGVG